MCLQPTNRGLRQFLPATVKSIAHPLWSATPTTAGRPCAGFRLPAVREIIQAPSLAGCRLSRKGDARRSDAEIRGPLLYSSLVFGSFSVQDRNKTSVPIEAGAA